MSKKPIKVEEPASAYTVKKPVAPVKPASPADKPVRYVDVETARKLNKEIMDKHHDLFRKLAQ